MQIKRASCTKQATGEHSGQYMGAVTIHYWMSKREDQPVSMMTWKHGDQHGNQNDDKLINLYVETGTGYSNEPEQAMHIALADATKKVTDKLHKSFKVGVEVNLEV